MRKYIPLDWKGRGCFKRYCLLGGEMIPQAVLLESVGEEVVRGV